MIKYACGCIDTSINFAECATSAMVCSETTHSGQNLLARNETARKATQANKSIIRCPGSISVYSAGVNMCTKGSAVAIKTQTAAMARSGPPPRYKAYIMTAPKRRKKRTIRILQTEHVGTSQSTPLIDQETTER